MCWIALSNALFESLKTSATERTELNQIFGSQAFGMYSPFAIGNARARAFSWDITPMTIFISAPVKCRKPSEFRKAFVHAARESLDRL